MIESQDRDAVVEAARDDLRKVVRSLGLWHSKAEEPDARRIETAVERLGRVEAALDSARAPRAGEGVPPAPPTETCPFCGGTRAKPRRLYNGQPVETPCAYFFHTTPPPAAPTPPAVPDAASRESVMLDQGLYERVMAFTNACMHRDSDQRDADEDEACNERVRETWSELCRYANARAAGPVKT